MIPVAIILAAGVGSRLGALTAHRPKTLLPLDDRGATILENIVESVLPHARRVVIVGGHASDVLGRYVGERWPQQVAEGRVTTTRFERYRTVNNLGTFHCVSPLLSEGGAVLNSDIVYDRRVLDRVAAQVRAAPGTSLLVVDDRDSIRDEEMKVVVREDGRAARVNKLLDPADCVGEFIGVSYYAPGDVQRVIGKAGDLLRDGKTTMYYEDAIDQSLGEVRFELLYTRGLRYIEIDSPEDYQEARALYAALPGVVAR